MTTPFAPGGATFAHITGSLRFILITVLAFSLFAGSTGGAGASADDTVEELFEAADLAIVITDHMQQYWDEVFRASDIPAETPYAVLFDMYSYGATGCGNIANYSYSFYCTGDDTVYINIDHVQDMREDFGNLYAAVLGVGQPLSMAVLDRIGALAFDRNGNADVYSREAAACLTGVWTNVLWYADIITEDDLYAAALGLSTIGPTLPEAYLFGFETEDPQSCIDVFIP